MKRLKKLYEAKAIVSDVIRKLEKLPLPKSELLEERRANASAACRKARAAIEAMIENESQLSKK